jgi:hypothetical protein
MLKYLTRFWFAVLSVLGWMPKTKLNPLPEPPKPSVGSRIILKTSRGGYYYGRPGHAPISGPCTPYHAIRAYQRYIDRLQR